ncbi:hypothetical protein [Streptosporangium sp. NPDC000396]|uniref:hypothetical protein n=1 Tax=Streptosporangium sp. NPDC000396 TaxID=3366185 RepID=UPI00368D833A
MLVLGVSWLILAPLCLWLLLRGPGPVRLGAVLALAGLEAATIWVNNTVQAPPAPIARPATMPVPAAEAAGRVPPCSTRLPVPERARAARSQGELRAVTFFWTASADECDTTTVVLRQANRRIRVWMHEGPMKHRPAGARTLPVDVSGGVASAEVRLVPPLSAEGTFTTVDGRTGRPITLR